MIDGVLLTGDNADLCPGRFSGLDVIGADVVIHCGDPDLTERWAWWTVDAVQGSRVSVLAEFGPSVRYGNPVDGARHQQMAGLEPGLRKMGKLLDADRSGILVIAVVSHWGCGGIRAYMANYPGSGSEEDVQYALLRRLAPELAATGHQCSGLPTFVITGIEPMITSDEVTHGRPGHIDAGPVAYAGPKLEQLTASGQLAKES